MKCCCEFFFCNCFGILCCENLITCVNVNRSKIITPSTFLQQTRPESRHPGPRPESRHPAARNSEHPPPYTDIMAEPVLRRPRPVTHQPYGQQRHSNVPQNARPKSGVPQGYRPQSAMPQSRPKSGVPQGYRPQSRDQRMQQYEMQQQQLRQSNIR